MSKVVIQFVTWNGAKYIAPLLVSLKNQTQKDWQLLIWDNASTDNTVGELENSLAGNWCEYKIFKSEKNLGFALAHSQLFTKYQISNIQYLFILNQDTVLEPDYLEKLVVFVDSHPKVAALAGKIMRLQQKDMVDTLGLKVLRTHRVVELTTGPAEPFEVFGVSGALPLYRLEAIKQTGFFDENFFSYKEDIDLAYRLRRAGWTAYCVPMALAYHDRGSGNGGILARHNRSSLVNYYSYRNHLLVLLKNLSWRDWLRNGLFILGYELAKAVYMLFSAPRQLFNAWLDIIRLYSKMRKEYV